MTFYLTFNDGPSGIFSSQVIDVVKFIREELKENIKLISFVSLRGFLNTRKKIKSELPEAIVVPMVPGITRWRKNYFLLALLYARYKPQLIVGRSVLATQLALQLKKNRKNISVVYDGRGAIAAEWKEYNVVSDPVMLAEISELERSSIMDSDYRIAVSHQLVNYWQQHYGYVSGKHVVIPCTLNTAFCIPLPEENIILRKRNEFGFNSDDIVLAYSGSIAGWQSFHLLNEFLFPVMKQNKNIKLLFLSGEDNNIKKIMDEFPGRVQREKVPPVHVPLYLSIADYGLLIREQSVTNKVASPVKFAEYLACGLKVIISEDLGDYSEFVKQNNCGFQSQPVPQLRGKNNRTMLRQTALNNFTKRIFTNEYKKALLISLN